MTNDSSQVGRSALRGQSLLPSRNGSRQRRRAAAERLETRSLLSISWDLQITSEDPNDLLGEGLWPDFSSRDVIATSALASDREAGISGGCCPTCGAAWCVAHLDPQGNIAYALSPSPDDGHGSVGTNSGELISLAPLNETFRLHSRPTATKTIYLDVDGHVTTGTAWNTLRGLSEITTPALSLDANYTSFSDTELIVIQNLWAAVSEDFAPFDVNVTTQAPSIDDLRKTGGTDTRWGIRVCIGGNNQWFGPAGGVAYLNSFNWDSDTPTFVFWDNAGRTAESAGMVTSHEVGHTLGLNHWGTTSLAYYAGHGTGETSWGPIMGAPYGKNVTTWSRGEYANASQTRDHFNSPQEDLTTITTRNGFSFRPDDFGGTVSTADNPVVVGGTTITASGVIERPEDVDAFRLFTAGTLKATISPSPISPNLDVVAEIWNSDGEVIFTSSPTESLSASFNLVVTPGTYFLTIRGEGKGDPMGSGYADYGSLGQYLITATVTSQPRITAVNDDVDPVRGLVPRGGVTNDRRLQINGTAAPGTIVTVTEGEAVIGTATTSASGLWMLVTSTLSDRRYVFRAAATLGGQPAGESDTDYVVTVDTEAPSLPTLSSAHDDQGPIQGVILAGGRTDDPQLRISGTAEPASVVTLFDAGVAIGTSTTNSLGAWFITTSTLAEGARVFTAKATDAAGNASGLSAGYGVDIDLTPPPPPSIVLVRKDSPTPTAIPSGGVTNDATPLVSGTATPGTTVTVHAGSVTLGTTVTTEDGTWALTTNSLADDTYSLVARAVDDVGNSSLPSSPAYMVTIDTTITRPVFDRAEDDVAPVLGLVMAGGFTNDNTPLLRGRAEPRSTVTVFAGSTVIGSSEADSDGAWSVLSGPFQDGAVAFIAIAVDRAGNASESSAPFAIIIDTVIAFPVVSFVHDDRSLSIGSIVDGGLTNDNRPTIVGTGEPHSTVTVRSDGVTYSSIPVGTDGRWSMPAGPLGDGGHAFVATAVDRAGNQSRESIAFHILIDTTVVAPHIIDMIDDVPLHLGRIDRGGLTNDATPTLSGIAEVGSIITIRTAGLVIGTAVANEFGVWRMTSLPLNDGVHEIIATAIDPAGNASGESTAFRVAVDTFVARPEVSSAMDAMRGPAGLLAAGGVTNQTRPIFDGTAEAGHAVTLEVGGRAFGPVVSRDDGVWSVKSGTLPDGTYAFAARATDGAGNVSALSVPFALTVDTVATAPTIAAVWDDVPGLVGPIDNGGTTNDSLLTVTGTAEPGNIVVVAVNTSSLASVVAGVDGVWGVALPRLFDGPVVITASATDIAGNKTMAVTPFLLTIDTHSSAPSITAILDDVPFHIGPLTPNSRTNDSTLTVSGIATPGDRVTVSAGGRTYGPVTVDADGRWGLHAPGLQDGTIDFSAVAQDAAGNTTAASERFRVTVDTTVMAPVITGLAGDLEDVFPQAGDLRLASATPVLAGTAEPETNVWVHGRNTVFGPVVSDSSGRWRLPLPQLTDGVHDFAARARDTAGNQSDLSGPAYSIRVDTVAPFIETFASSSVDGTYGIGQTIMLSAVFSERVLPTGAFVVSLSTGRSVTLAAESSGLTATGVYTVEVGDVTPRLDIVAITSVDAVRDAAGNALVPTERFGVGPSLGERRRIIVDGGIRAVASTGFSTDLEMITTRRAAATRIPISFTTPVTGLTIESFRLSLNGRSVSLRGASLQGEGASYTVVLPRRRSLPRGVYALEVVPSAEIRSAANGSSLLEGGSWFWRQGSVGQTEAASRRRAVRG